MSPSSSHTRFLPPSTNPENSHFWVTARTQFSALCIKEIIGKKFTKRQWNPIETVNAFSNDFFPFPTENPKYWNELSGKPFFGGMWKLGIWGSYKGSVDNNT